MAGYDLRSIAFENLDICTDMSNIRESYPDSLLPSTLNPRTGKAKRVLFEQIDHHLYEEPAKMVAFYTSVERLRPWIKALGILYYDNLGKRSDVNINWFDSPDHWTDLNSNANSVIFEVKDGNDALLYNVTLFMTTGTIRAQGQQYILFANHHFPILLKILGKVLEDNQQVVHSCDVIDSDLSESEFDTTVLNPIVHTPIPSSDADLTSEKQASCNTNISSVTIDHGNVARLQGVLLDTINKIEISREKDTQKQGVLLDTINKIEISREKDTQKILTAIANINMHSKPDKSSLENARMEHDITELRDENRKLKAELQMERNNALMSKAQYNELQKVAQKSNEDVDIIYKRLDAKNEEIESLETVVTKLKTKLSQAETEALSLKEYIGSLSAPNMIGTEAKRAKDDTEPWQKEPDDIPVVLLLGTSNIRDVYEDKITKAAHIEKHLTYTLEQAKQCIDNYKGAEPNMLILHILTNDLKVKTPEVCVDELIIIIEEIHAKWPKATVLVSTTTPRLDDINHHCNGQIINAMLNKELRSPTFKYTKLIEHPTLYKHGAADP